MRQNKSRRAVLSTALAIGLAGCLSGSLGSTEDDKPSEISYMDILNTRFSPTEARLVIEQNEEPIYSNSFEFDARDGTEVDGETINESIPIEYEETSISVKSTLHSNSVMLSELGGLAGERCIHFEVDIQPEKIAIFYSNACTDIT